MSLSNVLSYFDDKMKVLNYQEWPDEFNIDNIPRNQLDRVYHLEIGDIVSGPASHTCHVFDFPVILTVHSKISGAKGSSASASGMLEIVDSILCEMLVIEDRYSQVFQQVFPSSVSFEPIDDSNDNIVRVRIEFGVQIFQEYRRSIP